MPIPELLRSGHSIGAGRHALGRREGDGGTPRASPARRAIYRRIRTLFAVEVEAVSVDILERELSQAPRLPLERLGDLRAARIHFPIGCNNTAPMPLSGSSPLISNPSVSREYRCARSTWATGNCATGALSDVRGLIAFMGALRHWGDLPRLSPIHECQVRQAARGAGCRVMRLAQPQEL